VTAEEPNVQTASEPKWPVYVSAMSAVIASIAAIVSTSSVLRASELTARDRVFERKLAACGEISKVTTRISSAPQQFVSAGEARSQAAENINELLLVFPDEVNEAGLKLINQLDIVYAKNADRRPITSEDWGRLIQSSIDLNSACRADVRAIANLES
jgi:hypothetical protein